MAGQPRSCRALRARLSVSGSTLWSANGVYAGIGVSGTAAHPAAVGDAAGGVTIAWSQNMVAARVTTSALSRELLGGYDWLPSSAMPRTTNT